MRFCTILIALVNAGSVTFAAPFEPSKTIQKRADFCGQWDSAVTGPCTIYNNLWGESSASSGCQCTGVDSLSGTTLKWHTKWSWAGGAGQVKSYANVVTKISQKSLSSIKSLKTNWSYSLSGGDLAADVAYDVFTGTSASGTQNYEVMIWLAALGGAGPISATGSPIATVTLAGTSWKLYNGKNGQMNVFSFVASSQVKSFSGDLMDVFKYLISKQGMPSSQILQSVGAGTEPFSGTNAVLSTTSSSLTQS